MGIYNKTPIVCTKKNFGLFAHKYWRNQILNLLFLSIISITPLQSAQALNHPATMAFVETQQTNPGNSNEQSGDTTLNKEQDHNGNSSTSEIESVLARKAKSGSRTVEMENDRFYTILFYSLSIGTIALIIALFYFFINLNDKGKRLKMLKKRMEKLNLRKARSAV